MDFFLHGGEIKTTVLGFDRQRALRVALKRLIADVRSQHCNSIEITKVIGRTFLKVPYVSVFAHASPSWTGSCSGSSHRRSDRSP